MWIENLDGVYAKKSEVKKKHLNYCWLMVGGLEHDWNIGEIYGIMMVNDG